MGSDASLSTPLSMRLGCTAHERGAACLLAGAVRRSASPRAAGSWDIARAQRISHVHPALWFGAEPHATFSHARARRRLLTREGTDDRLGTADGPDRSGTDDSLAELAFESRWRVDLDRYPQDRWAGRTESLVPRKLVIESVFPPDSPCDHRGSKTMEPDEAPW
jgi:hypothetical protein